MSTPLEKVVNLLDLEDIEVNLFRGVSPAEERQRVFGGQVAGQALVAAYRTVETGRTVHSLHAYFIRPGDPKVPILYEVERLRDGKSFTTRRVVAIQHGKAIFNLQASFQVHEEGLEYQVKMPEGVPDPESLPTFQERVAPHRHRFPDPRWIDEPRPIDTRDCQDFLNRPAGSNSKMMWYRLNGDLPDDLILHQCLLTYASDMTLLDTIVIPHRKEWQWDDFQMASLDHAMWFHRPFRLDDWILYTQHTPSTGGSRGLAMGSFFTRDGTLVCSVAQEGLIREPRA